MANLAPRLVLPPARTSLESTRAVVACVLLSRSLVTILSLLRVMIEFIDNHFDILVLITTSWLPPVYGLPMIVKFSWSNHDMG